MGSIDSDDSNPNRFEIRVNNRAMVPRTRKRHDGDDDDEVSDMEAKLIRRKKPKTTTTRALVVPKIKWAKSDELLILEGIVDYETETKLSYRSDWNAFYGYIKCFVQANFSKAQLRSKVRKLKDRFMDNLAKSDNVGDDELFKLSMVIWGKKNDHEIGSNNENLDQVKDAADAEHDEQIIENVEQAKDDTDVGRDQINENVEQTKDATGVEHDEQNNENVEQAKASNISTKVDNGEKEKGKKVDNGEKEKSERVGVEEFCVLQDAIGSILFPNLGKTHEKLLLQNLKNLEAEKGKELSDEWKALLVEEMQIRIKKLAFSTKLAAAAAAAVSV